MSNYERIARVEGFDAETGLFQATLATEGEASDGHILSIKGGRIPARMPLLPAHWNDPTVVLGSLTNPQKELDHAPPRLRVTGQIEMDGKGMPLDLRQDIAHMIAKGHLTGMSIRWDDVDGKPPVRRVNLPSDHPAFVDEAKEKSWRKRTGFFFEHWQGMEGSVIPLGSDKKAFIGRAEETTGEVSTFWRAMAKHTSELEDPEIPIPIDFGEDAIAAETIGFGLVQEPDAEAQAAAALAALRLHVADCREAGASVSEIHGELWGTLSEDERADLIPNEIERTEHDYEQLQELLTQVQTADSTVTDARTAIAEAKEAMIGLRQELEAAEERATLAEAALEDGRVEADPPAAVTPDVEEDQQAEKDVRLLEILSRHQQSPHFSPLAMAREVKALLSEGYEIDARLLAAELRQQREPEFSPLEWVRNLRNLLEQDRQEELADFRRELDKKRGKVTGL